MVLLVKESVNAKIDLAIFIDGINKVLNTDLNIKIGGTTYKIKVDIDKGFSSRHDHGSYTVIKRAVKESGGPLIDIFYPLLGHRWERPYALYPFLLTKVFFCQIVKLYDSEYEIFDGGFSIFPNKTPRRFLFAAEMQVLEDDGAYICATDFVRHMSIRESQGSRSTMECGLLTLLLMKSIF